MYLARELCGGKTSKNIYLYTYWRAQNPRASTVSGTQKVVFCSRRPDNPKPILFNHTFHGFESFIWVHILTRKITDQEIKTLARLSY